MFIILILLLFILIILKIEKNWKRFAVALKIPGPWFIPFIGCIQIGIKMKPEKITHIVQLYRNKYRKTFRFFLGPNLWVFLHTPEEIKQALNNSTLRRATDFQHLKPILGEGLLLSEEQKWISRRRALTPAFHSKLLNDFNERINYHANILVRNLKISSGKSIEISELIFHCILDAICETSMGAEINSQNDPNCQYAKAYHEAFHILFQRMVNPILGFDFIFNRLEASKRLQKSIEIIHDMTDKVIKEKRKLIFDQNIKEIIEDSDEFNGKEEFGQKRKLAMLDILLSIIIDGNLLTDKDIKDEVNTFLFAGVDTTKAAMCFALYNLAKYKSLQDRIYNDIIEIVINQNESITADQIKSIKILDRFLKESLRLHTVVPLTGRQTTCETKIGNIIYPKNVSIWINMYGVAHDENFFPDPYKFNIDRFADDNEINHYAYLPFSAGPHNCIGKRYADLIIKIIMITIIKNFEVYLKNPNEQLDLISEMVLSSRQGFNLIFKERNL